MKQVIMPSVVQMDTETLRKLTTEVKETLATGMMMPVQKKRFAVVDLWKIHQGMNRHPVLPENGQNNIDDRYCDADRLRASSKL